MSTAPSNGGSPAGWYAETDDRIDALERFRDSQEDVNTAVLATLVRIETRQGHAPDPVNGDPGSGMLRILHGLANAIMTGNVRSPMQSIVDADESETTGVMDRPAIIARARASERRVKLLVGLATVLITTIGAVAVAYYTGR